MEYNSGRGNPYHNASRCQPASLHFSPDLKS